MIIDCHVHLFHDSVVSDRSEFVLRDQAFGALYSSPQARIASSAEIIDYIDKFSIAKAVVFGFPWKDRDLYLRNNDAVLEFSQKFPDRIVPFATFGLSTSHLLHRDIEQIIESGFKGLGELSMYETGWDYSSISALRECLIIASQSSMPVMIHVNEPVGHKYPGKIHIDFAEIAKLISDFPETDFILAHFGGGIFFYALMPEIRDALKRTYVDTAACPFIYESKIFEVCISIFGEDRILFGSDYPLLGLNRYLKELDKSSLAPSQKQGILGYNASKLMGL
ncbi:MAG: amidohydrolase family protein [Syntrophaceae bacterium]|nr:amidohydrolase family protein [Syntrophaceae bacterium]